MLQENINEINGDFQNKLEAELNQFKLIQDKNDELLVKPYESQIERLRSDIEFLKVILIIKA